MMVGDLMDALSDPRAFLSAQEKRMVQMKAMGIEETDIQAAANMAQSTRKEEEKKAAEDSRIEPVTLDHLKGDKSFLKLLRKQQKELESLKRKQEKEEGSVQKQQCVAIEKIVKQNGKKLDQLELAADPAVKDLVSGQIIQWTECLEKHRIAQYEMQVFHVKQRGDHLKRLLESGHANQMKTLDTRFERENKEMKGKQAKISVETAKEVSMDKTLRNKAERERRLREKNSNNTKKFIEERKAAATRQSKERERLRKLQEKQSLELDREIQLVSVNYSSLYTCNSFFSLTEP